MRITIRTAIYQFVPIGDHMISSIGVFDALGLISTLITSYDIIVADQCTWQRVHEPVTYEQVQELN